MPHNSGMPYPPTPGHTPPGAVPAGPALPTAVGQMSANLPPAPGPGATQATLTPDEMAELDQLVTPRLAFLISKAYPPAFEVFRQFFGDDLMQTQGLPQPVAPATGPGGPMAPTSGLAGAPAPQVPIPQGR